MKTNCWRCKALFDTSQVDTVETVGLCQKCWDQPSEEETPVAALALPNEAIEQVQQRMMDSLKVPKELLGYEAPKPCTISPEQFIHDPPWDDTEVRPKVFIEPSTTAIEHRIAERLTVKDDKEVFGTALRELPQKSGVDFVKLQMDNDPLTRSTFHKTVGMARLEQDLSEAIYQATKKFHNTNDFDSIRDEVKRVSVEALLSNTPVGFPKPPIEFIEKMVEECINARFGRRGEKQSHTRV
jgi:hypothetical protein